AEARLDGGGGVADMDHERAAADARAVDEVRRDAEVLGDGDGGLAGAEDAIDLVLRDAGVGEGVERGLGVELERRLVRNDADRVGLGRADDRGAHAQAHAAPRGRKKGSVICSFCSSNVTSSGMSTCSASGVCSTPTMFVIMCGPSSSWTMAIEYGTASWKPGAPRSTMTYVWSFARPLAVNHSTSREEQLGQKGRGKK